MIGRRGNDIHSLQLDQKLASGARFKRRFYHGSFISDNKLYIDGGEETGSVDGDNLVNRLNSTLAIDLTKPFNTSRGNGPEVQAIDKGSCPLLNYVNFWVDPSGAAYAYGGEWSFLGEASNDPLPAESLWTFKPSETGGTWTSVDLSADQTWSSLTRPAKGLSAYGASGGFNLGGISSSHTSPKTSGLSGDIPDPGLQFFDFDSRNWTNSTTEYSNTGTTVYGGMVYVPTWGSSGLLVAMGGQEAVSLSSFTENENLLSMDSVAVFDVAGAKWYHQPVSGDVPSDRDRFCVVGVQDSSNSTYEIFLYSGQAALNRGLFNEGYAVENSKRDEVFVLSLPSFTWSKADYNSSDPRIYHTCHGVGRYLLSIGGVDPSKTSSDEAFADDDLYEQGIKVFDMTTMQWLDEFKADGASYQKPVVVSSRIAATPAPTSWADDQLRQLFEKSNIETATPAAQQSSGSSRISAGAIVGAAVGGFAGVAIICLLMFFWRKRMLGARKNTSGGVRPSELSAVEAAKHEMPGDSEQPAELGDAGTQKPAELSTTFDHHELAGSEPFVERHEMA